MSKNTKANSPVDMLDYVLNNNLEAAFLNSLAYHVGGYTIAEITDRKFVDKGDYFKLISKVYDINAEIRDDDVVTALKNKLYVTPFLSRMEDKFSVHFFVHPYPESMKAQFDENILKEVIQYMILKAIVALRLDTEEKIDNYVK